ncbi:TRAP transporter large permease subunit [Paucihalobacter ruber]|uniref:TRAP transporter large permease subunit n=1 Tax=Paucihalobacter ruber TaxID=2567861 RepID=A0A506PKG9_9FLAO|nr:C4-dicarboxylate transporter DcuC [Paucihalobacter ruber]TPV34044.1 TRAP transporter large permease subunit [Paucihalobacter ruber]
MESLGPILSLLFIAVVARLLLKKYHPHAVLLFAGLIMLALSLLLKKDLPPLSIPTGFTGFDLFKLIKESFSETNAGVGLIIMSIGGFVAYIDHIGASRALVHIAMKPLGLFKSKPYLAASLVIPIGQMLFVAIPSAAGLSLLLMASLFPILTNLGVSKLSAASVITATTAFGMGPASAITASASNIIGMESVNFFVNHQIPLVWPLSLSMMVTYYIVNRYFDKKNNLDNSKNNQKEQVVDAPIIYAVIPILPIIILIVFSEIFNFFKTPIKLDTTTAMIISLFVAVTFELIRKRSFKTVFDSFKVFWNGMGNIFKTVVTLIIAAEIFAKGLISLGFIDGLLAVTQSLGLNAVGISIVMTVMIFLASMLMGSGNASFFAFGPLVPKIADKMGVESVSMILPMEFSANMGRTVSPIAGVIIAVSEIAGVSTLQIVKRNLIPLGVALVIMLIYHFI